MQKIEAMTNNNGQERRRVDDAFTARSDAERGVKEIEYQIAAHHEKIKERLSELAPAKQAEYMNLQVGFGFRI